MPIVVVEVGTQADHLRPAAEVEPQSNKQHLNSSLKDINFCTVVVA